VEANGASFYVEEHGEGAPIVLVQGGLASNRMYDAVVPLLASQYRVIAFDSRGHGFSTNPSGELSYRLIADDTAALIEALDLDRPFVGGWSDGGQVALEFGIHHPDAARGLIVGGAYTDFQSEAVQARERQAWPMDENGEIDFTTFERERSRLAEWLASFHPVRPDQWQRIVQQTVTMWLEYPGLTQEQVAQITLPALLIYGDRDRDVPYEAGLQLFGWLSTAELAVLPGCDHFRPFQEPTTFVSVISDFIQRHQGS
jgi:pimeloyl-ACP methyl ester carboxylesterase